MNGKNIAKTNPDEFTDRESANRDAITGTPGSHPVGTGIGAVSAGAAGAAIGAAAGPVGSIAGAAIGAVVGAVAGGLAGKGIAETINPTAEDAYWRENYKLRPYVRPGATYDDYLPAYRYGWEAPSQYPGRSFDDVEDDLRERWLEENPNGDWEDARAAVRDSYNRIVARPNAESNADSTTSSQALNVNP
jgi:hypothetical protein